MKPDGRNLQQVLDLTAYHSQTKETMSKTAAIFSINSICCILGCLQRKFSGFVVK